MKNAHVTFTHTIVVENVENMTEEDIAFAAADMFNELPMEDMYKTTEDIIDISIMEEK